MIPIATTDDIRLTAASTDEGGTVTLAFHSPHLGCDHQLYLNGRLAAWTDTPRQRSLAVPPSAATRSAVIVAVSPAGRRQDLAERLGIATPSWVHRVRVVRSPSIGRDDRLQLLTDAAGGTFLPEPVAQLSAWPANVPRWAWGEDAFARGGFGLDGAGAPGAGQGAFGAGMFGLDERVLELTAVLDLPGTHRLKLRTLRPDGRYAETEIRPDRPSRFPRWGEQSTGIRACSQ